jgi:hypothetical protein
MGNQTSSQAEQIESFSRAIDKFKLRSKNKNKTNSEKTINTEALKGAKASNITEMSISNDTTSVVTAPKDDMKGTGELKIPTVLEWKEGGKVVYINGSFSHWTQWFIMKRKDNGHFELVIDLPRGVYEYKFIVDNIWRHSSQHPICKDSKGNINNVINTLNSPEKKQEIKISNDNLKYVSADGYTQSFFNVEELNTDAPVVPFDYSIPFSIDNNTNQDKVGQPEYINLNIRQNFCENSSAKSILNTPHANV